MMRRPVVVLLLALSACGWPAALTGLGAHLDAWTAHHGTGYTDVLTDADARVTGYNVAMSPRTLAAAVALVRADLPADAAAGPAVLGIGVEATKCEIVDFTSPTLRTTLGSSQVMAVFSTEAAVTMDTTRINHAVVVSATLHYPHTC